MRKLFLLLVLLAPLAASGQGITRVSPQPRVWRAGDAAGLQPEAKNSGPSVGAGPATVTGLR